MTPITKMPGKGALGAKRLLGLRHHVAGFLDGDVETDPAAAVARSLSKLGKRSLRAH